MKPIVVINSFFRDNYFIFTKFSTSMTPMP